MVLLTRGEERVHGDSHVAVGAVLEADRRRQAGRQLAVHLAFGGARADRAPGHQVADVLRRDHVEELAAGGHSGPVDAHQQVARDAQPLVDAEAAVEVRIVDQAFPAHRGARLLEVHAHQQLELVAVTPSFLLEFSCVFQRRERIVDRARPHHHQQPLAAAVQDLAQPAARLGDQGLDRRALDRKEADQVLGRRQRDNVLDALVVGKRGLVRRNGGEIVVEWRSHRFLPKNKNRHTFRLAVFVGSWGLSLAGPVRQQAEEIKGGKTGPPHHRERFKHDCGALSTWAKAPSACSETARSWRRCLRP